MMPIIPNNMKYYTGSSPAYAGSSPYAIPDQPPFTSHSRRPSSTRTPRTYSQSSSSTSSTTSIRRPSIQSTPSGTEHSSSDLLQHYNSHSDDPANLVRASRTPSTASLTGSIKSLLNIKSSEERAAKKAAKERERKVQRAEKAAYERAQQMEATALYMSWRYGEGPNTETYCMF